MKIVLTACLACTMLLSCNDSGENNTPGNINEDQAGTTTKLVDFSGCYVSIMGRDTFAAQLRQDGQDVNGRLSFDNFEKDGSTGTVMGRVDGNIIRLKYEFQSEGMQSVMDVYFKVLGDSLLRGVGEMSTRGDTAYFVDRDNISYEGSAFKKIPCDDLNEKYRASN